MIWNGQLIASLGVIMIVPTSGVVRPFHRLLWTLILGIPASCFGIYCGGIAGHGGNALLIPYAVLCPFFALITYGFHEFGGYFRGALNTRFDWVATFCLLQFLYYYLIVAFIARRRMRRTHQRRRSTLAALGAVLGIAAAWLFWNRPSTYSPGDWKRARGADRARMVHDLIDSKALVGKTAPEVMELVGPPDEDVISYNIDGQFISIHFGAGGRASIIDIEETRRLAREGSDDVASIKFINWSSGHYALPVNQSTWEMLGPEERLPYLTGRTRGEVLGLLGLPKFGETMTYRVGNWGRQLYIWLDQSNVKSVTTH